MAAAGGAPGPMATAPEGPAARASAGVASAEGPWLERRAWRAWRTRSATCVSESWESGAAGVGSCTAGGGGGMVLFRRARLRIERSRRAAEGVFLMVGRTARGAGRAGRAECAAGGVDWSADEREAGSKEVHASGGRRGSKRWRRSVAGRSLDGGAGGVGRMPSAAGGGAGLGADDKEWMVPRSSGPWLLLKTIW